MNRIQLLNEDCMYVMSRYSDNYFDLAIVDPPYGINADSMQMGSNPTRSKNDGYGSGPAISTAVKLKKGRLNQGGGKLKNRLLNRSDIGWDNEIPSPEYFKELKRVSKNQIIWGGNYFPLPPTRCVVCWNKMQPWENFSQWEMAWTSFDKPSALFSLSNTGGANSEVKIHPTQKPIKLYQWLLKRFADRSFKILDTHLGSASSAIAAHDFGVNEFVGCEIDVEYYEKSLKRYKQNTSQLSLFITGEDAA